MLLNFAGVSELSTTFSLSKLQAVPEWNAEAVVPAPHTGGAGSAASSTRLATIDRAEPCFITNVSAYTHQQAHFINAIRGKSDKQADGMAAVGKSMASFRTFAQTWPSFFSKVFL